MSGQPNHGESYCSEYRAWQTMRLRCTNPNNRAYHSYGGRGIKVCSRWMRSVIHFIEDMGRKPSPFHELDRIDNDGDYCPENCRWVLRKVNDRNKRNNRRLTYKEETQALAEWCERFNLPRDTVRKRLESGWSVAKALETPLMRRGPIKSTRRAA